jgi:beta-glucosidase
LQKSLTDVGFKINPDLTTFYKNNDLSGRGRTNGNGGWMGRSDVTIGETPFASYTDALKNSMENDYNDAAVMVITREGSEGCDVKTCNAHDSKKTNSSAEKVSDRHALQLSENEEALFEELKKHTDNIIIVVNSGNIFQCDKFENDDKVKAILWIGNPGAVGAKSVGKILTGQVNPSGRTVDTWARDFTKDPTFQNFSDNSQTNEVVSTNGKTYYAPQDTLFAADGAPMLSYGTDKNYKEHSAPRWDTARGGEEFKVVSGGLNGVKPASYLAYEEGIYVDYRYYETRYADMAKANKGDADSWYGSEEGVIYPFGYGLSYTSFKQEIVSSNVKGKTLKNGIYDIEVKVKVKNTGNVAGKDVVQLYWKAPYTKGGIEKADRVLCAFAKTKLLNKGESETLTLKINTQDFANYDFADKNGNGFKGYELDGGDYYITLNQNAHEELGSVKFSVAKEGIKYDKDRYTGHEVKNRFTDRGFYDCLPGENDFDFEQYSREDMANVPTHPTYEDRTVKAGSRYEEYLTHEFRMEDLENENKGLYIPEEVNKTKADIEALGWTQPATAPSQADSIQFQDLVGLDINDPLWEQAMNQMTYNEMIGFSYGGGQHNQAISRMGKPATGDSDGPSQFQIIWWAGAPIVAATYNVELAKKQGECVGMEAHLSSDTYGWAGPGVNIHRTPYSGRNYEYYSEDPILSGKMAAEVVRGAKNHGLYAYVKHFTLAEEGPNPRNVNTWLSEQAYREIYLRPFEIAVKEGKAVGIMSGFNNIGSVWCGSNAAQNVDVLRNEWGFRGTVVTDWSTGDGAMNPTRGIRAGNDIWLNPGTIASPINMSDATTVYCAKMAARNTLFTFINTRYTAAHYDTSLDEVKVEIEEANIERKVFPWRECLVATDVVIGVGVLTWIGLVWVLPIFRKKA